ncbi:MAG: zeta toxin family protein [Bacteroidota bacterium]|nr:zeta toxin family protein [Bacteroidota bacterium]
MPEFTVIAGPTGAGKTTFAEPLSPPHALVFNPDAVWDSIQKKFPGLGWLETEMELRKIYKNYELSALGTRQHLIVESNMRGTSLVDSAAHFKKQGYQTGLIFILLADVDHAFSRANSRVKQDNDIAHAGSIINNFEESVRRLRQIAGRFEYLMLLDGSIKSGMAPPVLLATYKDHKLLFENSQIPDWATPILNDIKAIMEVEAERDQCFYPYQRK